VLVFHAKTWRNQWAKDHDKPKLDLNVQFLDLGSGDGSVLLAVSVLTACIEGGPWGVTGIENIVGVHASSIEWLMAIGRRCPMMLPAVEDIQRNIYCRDACNPTDTHVVRCLGQADVIFINNLCFDATIHVGGRTVNMMLIDSMMKFCTIKSAPTLIITTSELTTAESRTPLIMHGNLLSQVGSFHIDSHGFNWGNGSSLKMYMHAITRAPSRKP
jgi:hypothetical protein